VGLPINPRYEDAIMSGWAWLIWTGVCIAAALAAVAGGLLLAFAVAGQRRTVRCCDADGPHGRCDCCGYQLEGLENGFCPECGWQYADNRRLPRIRRLRTGVAGIGLLVIAGLGALSPQVVNRGSLSLIPDTALIILLPLAPGGEPGTGPGASANIELGSALHRALQSRIDAHGLDGWERSMLAARCAGIVASDRDESVRAAAAKLLVQVAADAEASTSLMLSGLDDRSAPIRGRVLEALGVLAAQGVPGPAQDQIVQRLMGAAVCDRDEVVRRQAIEALGRLRTDAPGAAGVYARAARDPSPMVRVRTMYSLCAHPLDERDDDRKLAALTLAAHDPHAGVREAAVFALSRVAERRPGGGAVLLIGLCLRDQSCEVREMAAGCLAKLGPLAAPALNSLLARVDDEDPGVQEAVMNALTAIGS
jgi:HEAT repeat protein